MHRLMSRYSKKIVSLVIAVMALTIGICSFSFDSYATDNIIVQVPYSEPTTSDYSGYINVLYVNSNGQYGVWTTSWFIQPEHQNNESGVVRSPNTHMDITVDGNIVRFQATNLAGLDTTCVIQNYVVGFNMVNVSVGNGEPTYNYEYDVSVYGDIVSFAVYGNYGTVLPTSWGQYPSFTVLYGSDSAMYDKLSEILNSLLSMEETMQQTDGDREAVEEFNSTSKSQSDSINELNEQNKTDKIDVDSTSSEIDSNIDTEAIENYGTVLSVFTSNTHILQYILIVLAVALIAYVLFGKR